MSDTQTGIQESNPISDFDDKFQRAIVGHMMRDRTFRLMIFAQGIKNEHFRDPYLNILSGTIHKAHIDGVTWMQGPIGKEELKQETYKGRDASDRSKLAAAVEDSYLASAELKLEQVTNKMTGWLRVLALKKMILQASSMVNKKDFDKALTFANDSVRSITDIDFTSADKYFVEFKGTVDFLLSQDENRFKSNCTTGSPEFDELLLAGAQIQTHEREEHFKKLREAGCQSPLAGVTRGALMPGDATILLGPVNAGKTTIICTVVAMNILMGKDVLLIVHEQHADDLKVKILQSMLFMAHFDLAAAARNPVGVEKIERAEAQLRKHLCYVHYIRAGQMNVEAVAGIIEARQDKWKAGHGGKGFDLMVNDYPGKLSATSLHHRVNIKKFEEQAFVYDYLINLGREHKFHSFLAMQTNRDGYKAVQGSNGQESRVVDMGDAGDSFGPMQLADNVITINRNDEDKREHRIRLYVSKSRKSQTGGVFVSKTDMARSRAYGPGTGYVIGKGGEIVKEISLPCFILEGKVAKEKFDEMCAKNFGAKTLSDGSDKALISATFKAVDSKQDDALEAIMKVSKEPVV